MSAVKPSFACLALILAGCTHAGPETAASNCVVVRYENGVRHEVCDTDGRVELRETGTAPAAVSAAYLQTSLKAAMPELKARKAPATER
jgi:hypothetical protein